MFARTASWILVLALVCTVLLSHQAVATTAKPVMWILSHGSMKTSRVDPIVSPNAASSHVHNFVGMNGVDADTTTVKALEKASTCTTAPLTDDKSSYWAPQLYSYNKNGTFSPNKLSFVNTYYLMRGNVKITAFPQGLKMVAGNAKATGPGATRQAQNTVSFVCLNYDEGSYQQGNFPQTACPQGLRTQVIFPSCWNGKSLYEKDMSHVIYPDGDNADNGPCPSSHKIRLPTLFYEYIWNVGDTNNHGNSTWILANGDALGYSFHADFFANWNETTLQDAIDECSGNLFGNIESCPPLARSVDRKAANACEGTSTEPLTGAFASLPGCNIVYNGPHAGQGLAPGCDPKLLPIMPAGGVASADSVSSKKSSKTSSRLSAATASPKKHTTTTKKHSTTSTKKHHSTSTAKHHTTSTKKHHTTSTKKHHSTSTKKHHSTSTKKHHTTSAKKHHSRATAKNH